MSDILNLAYLRIIRKWKNSLLFFLVLLLSFSSAIVSVSVVGSIGKTNGEYKLNTYGEWYFAIPNGYVNTKDLLTKREWVDKFGTAQSVGTLSSLGNKIVGFGTIDEKYIEVGRIRLDQGVFPSSDSEIAMEKDSLSALGYDDTLGQEITVTFNIPLKNSQRQSTYNEKTPVVVIEKTYTLCGIIHEYSDLWYLQSNRNHTVLNSAVISDTAVTDLLAEAEEMLEEGTEFSVRKPVLQYFISVSEENRDVAKEQLNDYLYARFNDGGEGDLTVCVNTVAYLDVYTVDADDFYMYVIAILAFISILCLGIIRLPSDIHSFSVLRSVGMSKGQLGLMQIFETLILGIPAILLGIPIGAGLTWLVLRLTLYSGSVDIQVYIPYETLFFTLGLWFAAIIISRLVIFVFTLRVPMIGRLQMNTSKSKGARIIRNGFIVLLLCVFSESVIFTGIESIYPEEMRQYYSNTPAYDLSYGYSEDGRKLLFESDKNAIEEIPGVSKVYGFSEVYVGLSFDGLSEEAVFESAVEKDEIMRQFMPFGMVYLLVIDENDWSDIFDFGSDITAFHNGEFVYVSAFGVGDEYPLPEEEAVISVYKYDYEQKNFEKMINSDKNECKLIGSCKVNTKVMYISRETHNRTLASIWTPYTVICSEQFFIDLLKTLPKGEKFGYFRTGGEFGYCRMQAMADLNSDDLSTDTVIARICDQRNISLRNERRYYLAIVQENVQSLIMLCFSGACIAIIALMILWSNVVLEAKNEKHGFYIKRCIGMSKRQVDLNIFGKSLLRCLSAFLAGWLVYIPWSVFETIRTYENSIHENNESIDFVASLKLVIKQLIYYFKYKTGVCAIVLFLGLVLPLILILYAKKDLRKDGDIK